jgi:hypothetical protein
MRRLLISVLVGVAVLGGSAACGPAGQDAASAASFSPEGEALAAMGFEPQDIAAAEPGFTAAALAGAGAGIAESASPQPTRKGGRLGDWRKRKALRVMLTRGTLHGEAVVQKKDGTTVTVVVQRGVITELTDTSVTVKSADGFTLTWTLSDQLRVVEKRTSVQPSAVKVGQEIGVAGAKDGEATIARLILIAAQK